MEEARILDTADRFVNCKSVKYLFRVNRVERAIEVAGLFTRVSSKWRSSGLDPKARKIRGSVDFLF